MVRPRVFFDFSIDNAPAGRVIFELFSDSAPKTCENFRALCTGEKGLSPLSERPLYYRNSIIHRSINGFMIQGGDFTKRNGTGGESIYGGTFADEDLSRPLDSEGLLCMANKGPDTNGSQFFITLRDCPHLNGKHVVFGRVLRGYAEVIDKIADVPVDEKDRPRVPITIANCGELVLRAKAPSQEPQDQIAKPRAQSASDVDGESDGGGRHKKRRHRRSESRGERDADPDGFDSEGERRHKHKKSKHRSKSERKSKSKSKRDRASSLSPAPKKDVEPEEETEEQYDARLEREEKERLEAAKKRELERLKRRLEQERADAQTTNGVRFKGRGRMKYVDPEIRGHRGD
ncbi:hypothetical protein WOLCODRAFT_89912 [Wolfiporia cocos MD-104 SS10]|uniref:peptidylprolyl isomerase n=1 Tax=Wolfiporia cocos (strain MD-104) TaxID=742152 RepID=A0A2H3JM78_WOLCO|nr:hypothetical protein WOLCODRAFT_89912 [Wolfiporia cocos MD-104 SS10]